MKVIAEGIFEKIDEWIMVTSLTTLEGISTVGFLTIKTPGYDGDLIIDHVLLTESYHYDECVRQINISFQYYLFLFIFKPLPL